MCECMCVFCVCLSVWCLYFPCTSIMPLVCKERSSFRGKTRKRTRHTFVEKTLFLPEQTTVTNLEPNFPVDEKRQADGCEFWKAPAIRHSSAVRKCVLMSRRCLTVPFLTSSATRSVKIQPTFWRPKFDASWSTFSSLVSSNNWMLSGVSSCKGTEY